MHDHDSGYYTYRDKEVSLRIPRYLRPKKGIRYFAPKRKTGGETPLLGIAVTFYDTVLAFRTAWSAIMAAISFDFSEVRTRIIRRGKADSVAEGLELFISCSNILNNDVLHSYKILFVCGSRRVQIDLFGRCELALFERLCRDIVVSVRTDDGSA
ncbi:MAG TPA: hypothetical protein VFC78_18975 [Tepidisphaeraceae bacterium]|nr:hypothetical protein [Tepidisphaeraceae bacterium]